MHVSDTYISDACENTRANKCQLFIKLFEYCKAAKKQKRTRLCQQTNGTATTPTATNKEQNNPNNPLKIDKMSLQRHKNNSIYISDKTIYSPHDSSKFSRSYCLSFSICFIVVVVECLFFCYLR